MSAEQMRKEFEEWFFAVEGFSLRSERFADSKECAWAAWQAALATQPQAPQGAVTGWQPIETAPTMKDVLACNPCGFVGRAHKDAHGRWNHIGNPTHWMPIPAAPETPEGKK